MKKPPSNQAYRDLVPLIAEELGLPQVPDDWSGCGDVWPLLERMREDGAVVLIKLDGERRTYFHTVVVSGGRLLDPQEVIRSPDHRDVEDALANAIVRYAELGWRTL